MIIVAGKIHVEPQEREAYLAGCRGVIEQARDAPGCLDFHLSADPVEPGRINVFEKWASAGTVEAFRDSGPSSEQTASILDAEVFQHEVATTTRL